MRAKFSRRKKIKFFILKRFKSIILFMIFFLAVILFFGFNKKITPNLIAIAESSINKLNE